MSEEFLAKAREIRKALAKKEGSLPIQLMESDLYDWNPGARMTLMVIALGSRTNPDAYVPEDMPDDYKAAILGWCDMSQWRIALRAGKSESQVHRDIMMFETDGVIEVRRWQDSNNADHDMYRVNGDVLKERKRPKQKPDVERPARYKKPRPKKGWFSSKNQPPRVSPEIAEMDEE
ncbi:MAG: hypothetical protein WBQ34_00315 [Candidatus Acidiferrales bacterium]